VRGEAGFENPVLSRPRAPVTEHETISGGRHYSHENQRTLSAERFWSLQHYLHGRYPRCDEEDEKYLAEQPWPQRWRDSTSSENSLNQHKHFATHKSDPRGLRALLARDFRANVKATASVDAVAFPRRLVPRGPISRL